MDGPCTVVEPRSGWSCWNWRELLAYRDLFRLLVWRDIKVLYAHTIFGFSWALIRPLSAMVLFSAIFGGWAQMPSDGTPYPLFAYAALLPWTYFSTAMTGSTQSLLSNTHLLTKVYFPRIFIPLVPVCSKLLDFAIAFSLLLALMAFFGVAPSWQVIGFPLLVLLMMLTAAGLGLWLSALAIQFRDVKHGVQFLSQFLLYATPVVWPVSLVPDQYRLLYGLYPMAGVIEGIRSSFLQTNPMPWDLISTGTLSALGIFASGAFYFRRMERIFADVA